MDTLKMPTSTSGFFPLLDLQARVESESGSSISLNLGRFTNRPDNFPADFEWFLNSGENHRFFEALGWVDLHYPCKGHRKAFIRINIPEEYLIHDYILRFINALFDLFSISHDTLYFVSYFSLRNEHQILPKDMFGTG